MCSWKSVIKQCNTKLQELLNLNCLTTKLYAEGLLTDQEQQELTNEAALPSKQNLHFIQKILPFKGEQSFKRFLKVLENENQHCGHKELFESLAQCYARTCVQPSLSSELANLTQQELKSMLGEVIKDAMRDQIKEVITLQRKHEELEINRHKFLINLIHGLFNHQRNNSGVDADDHHEDQRKISVASSITNSSAVGSAYSADCEELSDSLSTHSGDYSEDMKSFGNSLYSPDDEQMV